ncbi:hypothetical protein QUF72_06900, partial [Desulfobacterales bacterium HSG2]|nr:hypothetical protein [Desulfobacterales bacterium HSG2]
PVPVGWVKRSETHHTADANKSRRSSRFDLAGMTQSNDERRNREWIRPLQPNTGISESCVSGTGSEPAYLLLKWEADMETDHSVCVRLTNPDTLETLYDITLGAIRCGE